MSLLSRKRNYEIYKVLNNVYIHHLLSCSQKCLTQRYDLAGEKWTSHHHRQPTPNQSVALS
ncbi:hypothetical protein Hanom_Chr08g00691621 [Helianthus anomalus]